MAETDPLFESLPSITVVLPVLNESRDIGRLLEELVAQEQPRGGFEVIVADGGSTDGTQDVVRAFSKEHPNIRLLPNEKKRSSAGRNVGARAARGQYVLFLDGHCALPRNDYLLRVQELFESTGAACLCRPQPLNQLKDEGWAVAISRARHSQLGHNVGSDIYGGEPSFTDPKSAGAAYQRSCIEHLGGYDERFDACEDVEFNHRVASAGYRSYRHPDLAVFYRPRSSLWGLFRQMFRYGRGRARLMARHPDVVPWPLAAISACIWGAIALPLIVDLPIAAPLLGAAVLLVLLLLMGESIRLAGFSREAVETFVVFPVIYAGLTLGFWRGLLEYLRFRPPASSLRGRTAI